MNKTFILKVLGMLILIALMAIAVSYVNNIIRERQHYQNQVKRDIAQSAAHQQTITGPILAVPYVEEYTEYIDDITPKGATIKKKVAKKEKRTAYFLPENLQLSGAFSNEYKQLGIYKALMYQLGGNIQGTFQLPANFDIKPNYKGGEITVSTPYIGFGISDTRGIIGKPTMTVDNKPYKFKQGSRIHGLGKGIHIALDNIQSTQAQTLPFRLDINLLGMEDFSFMPIAETNTVKLSSSWQHPHFYGSFLPINKKISDQGFQATWSVSSLSSSNQTALINRLVAKESIHSRHLESLAVGFVDPVNVYSQSDRATKYGLLFIGLTFAGFFLFEVLKQLRIHPAQYTLVGLAMAMFYLLLISFAERIGFAYAYLTASAACVLLLGYYLSYVLKSKVNGFTFASLLTILYGALYLILDSEDNALVMGSVLVFGLLATAMIITRKVDWYALGTQK